MPGKLLGGFTKNQGYNPSGATAVLYSLCCTIPNCTVLIKQEVVATLYQLPYPVLSVVCLSQQSQWVKPPNDSLDHSHRRSPWQPRFSAVAKEEEMIGKKKWCRSAQTRHLFFFFFLKKKTVRCKSGAHSPFPWLLVGATKQGVDLREATKGKVTGTLEQRWDWTHLNNIVNV